MIVRTKCAECGEEKEWNVRPGYSFASEKCGRCIHGWLRVIKRENTGNLVWHRVEVIIRDIDGCGMGEQRFELDSVFTGDALKQRIMQRIDRGSIQTENGSPREIAKSEVVKA